MSPDEIEDELPRRQKMQSTADRNPSIADEPGSPDGARAASGAVEISATERFATHLRETSSALFMYGSLTHVLRDVDTNAYKVYRDKLLLDSGNPGDPIVTMQIEQLALAHLNIGQLYFKASNARSIESEAIYLAAAARLMGEFRRSALGLQAMRAASIRLAEMAVTDSDLPSTDVIDPGHEFEENHHDTKIGATHGDDDAGPTIHPFPRRATI